jgi:hypothetical protein
MKVLVDAEMNRFQGLQTPASFVPNVTSDRLLGLKIYPVASRIPPGHPRTL